MALLLRLSGGRRGRACGCKAGWFLLMWARALSFHTTRFCALQQEKHRRSLPNENAHARAHTLHMQSIERSDRQNKQLVPTPHNTLSVRPMTTPGPVAINSSSINYVFACWSFNRCTSFHVRTPHLIPLNVECGFLLNP